MEFKMPETTCSSCVDFKKSVSERYCEFGKRPRRFRSKDPKSRVPAWCPKKNNPPVVRSYDFVGENIRSLTLLLDNETYARKTAGLIVAHPLTHRYELSYEGHINMTAKKFYETVKSESIGSVNGYKLTYGCVVEIDDGIKLYYFYYQGINVIQPAEFALDSDCILGDYRYRKRSV